MAENSLAEQFTELVTRWSPTEVAEVMLELDAVLAEKYLTTGNLKDTQKAISLAVFLGWLQEVHGAAFYARPLNVPKGED